METPVKRTRRYRSRLREEQARLTRQRVLAAARRLLVGHGFAQVTMQAVAQEAGVAYQTVYGLFGTKLGLALEVCDADLAHVGPLLAILAQAEDADDAEGWPRTLATVARRLYEPCADVLRFMRESGDPELVGRFKEIERSRRELLAALGPRLTRSVGQRPSPSAVDAVDVVWVLAGPETYEQLVLDRGWTPDRFEHWLGSALLELAGGPTPSRTPRPRTPVGWVARRSDN